MLIVALNGGLGNQMFQYAFYLACCEHYKDIIIKVDTSMLKKSVHNGLELVDVFGINLDICERKDVARCAEFAPLNMWGNKVLTNLYRIRRYFFGTKNSYIHQENATCYYKEVFELNRLYSYYLDGIWANEMYFKSISEKIKKTFVFKATLNEKNLKIKERIENSNSVSIHIRLGDYKKYKNGVLPISYYKNAISYIEEHVRNPQFFIFSDDINEARKIIKQKNSYFIDGNIGRANYLDMYLMSLCKNNIITNSTFSFWAAYLNNNPGKVVVYPQIPFMDCKYPYACENWVMIDCE